VQRVTAVVHDLRYSLRALRKQPGFTLVAVVTLALGIGANTAIFGIVHGVLLRPLPYRDADRVVLVWSHWTNWTRTWVSEPELADYRAQSRSLEDVAGFTTTSFNLTGSGEPLRVRAAQVQAQAFAALGAAPIAGRVFTADEDRPGHDRVALLSEGLWRSHFAGDPSVIGRDIQLDAATYEVVGVLPGSMRLPTDYGTRAVSELWVPLALASPDPQARGNHGLNALARLRPGVSLQQAQAEMDTITRGFQQSYPNNYDPEFGATLVTAPEEVFGDVRPALLVLLLAVGAVLLIACANVANLLLARSDERQKELAIRVALGAGRGRIVRQLLTESLVLSGIGGACGVALAYALMRALVVLDPLKIPRVEELGIDTRILLFAGGISLFAGVIFGTIPALQASRANPHPALKAGASTGWLRHALVVGAASPA
jgi:putative ABC transport system permease protein